MAAMKTLIEAVKTASAEDRALLLAALGGAPASSVAKVKKEKRATTNVEGPAAWNLFVKETQKTMAAAAGVDASSMDEAAFKKAASAKDSGFGWQLALKEASRRKAVAEGRDPEAPKPKTAKAKAKDAVVAAPAPPAPKAPAKDKDAAKRAEFAELNMSEFEFEGKTYWLQQDCLEVYEVAGPYELGERLGVWDLETESIDSTQ